MLARSSLLLCFVVLAGCEVVANFDPEKQQTDRTIGPVPIPSLDGAAALIPDATVTDAQIQPELPDASAAVDASDFDASGSEDAAVDSDGAGPIPLDAGDDSGNDGAVGTDISFADAAPE